MPASSGSKMAKPLEGEYADLGCMFSKAHVKKEVQVDSSPETSTKVGTSIVASEAPSDGSHVTVASKPVAEQPVDENPVAAKPLPEKNLLLSGSLRPRRTTTLSTIACPNVSRRHGIST